MAARVPVKGSLSFLDSRGTPHADGIDVGQEQSMTEPRSHIEGATPATAIWSFGIVPDPFTPPTGRSCSTAGSRSTVPRRRHDRGAAQPDLRAADPDRRRRAGAEGRARPARRPRSPSSTRASRGTGRARAAHDAEYEARRSEADDLEAKAAAAETAGKADEADGLRAQAAALHSPPVPLEMTFNVYRTTKGALGEPVYAEIEVTNPRTGRRLPRTSSRSGSTTPTSRSIPPRDPGRLARAT